MLASRIKAYRTKANGQMPTWQMFTGIIHTQGKSLDKQNLIWTKANMNKSIPTDKGQQRKIANEQE